ncbi:hypothetical protein H2201_006706 [Coniosporium apollinis]|uniref:Carboxylic ester hydrolase n=1 Tax=Coniosporium apollinis TaxID=61459 RepID=A0ABQ9NLW1_9PEZI|nr:hypothetical protein H2201_006706 [Coniosporium apollinis]
MSTNTGHNSTSGDITWALNQPEQKIDWGYRAMHGSIVLAKDIIRAYYASSIKYSYYSGCSTGGRQGLKELQLHPDSFDGVLAGAPAWWTSHLQPWTAKLGSYNLPVNASHHIPPTLFPVIAAEVLRQCDGSDDVEDGIISDPARCNFYPEALLCSAANTNASSCLTAPQISTLYQIYNDYVDTNQTFVFPALPLGSEPQWPVLLGGSNPHPLGTQYVQYFLLNDPNWRWQDFSYRIVELADQLDPGNATADDFDMSDFAARGGKLLMYHGLADALIPPGSSEYFYKHVLKTLLPRGVELAPWYRFFLVPGMLHCGGTAVNAPWYFAGSGHAAAVGTGAYSTPGFEDARHDALLALMQWTENGVPVDELIATKFRNDTNPAAGVLRQRPLCPYPRQAVHRGGDVDLPDSWECQMLYS